MKDCIERKYYKQCIEQINNKYSLDAVIDRCTIIDICDFCIELLVQDFTTELDRYKNPHDIFHFMMLYSELATEKQHSNDSYIFMQMCRYVFMLIPKLNLSFEASPIINIKKQDFSDVIFITKMIDIFAQQKAIQLMNTECVFQLERNDCAFPLTFINESFASTHTLINKANQRKPLLQKHCFNSDLLKDFSYELYKAFGKVTDKLHEEIFDAKLISNCVNNISFKEKKEIVEGRISKNMQNNKVINISKLFIEYPNNNFLQGLVFSLKNSDINTAIKKPFNKNIRTRFRPILEFYIDGIKEYYIVPYMYQEAIEEICGNLLPFKDVPQEWANNQSIFNFASRLFQQHDKWLEELVCKILDSKGYLFLRNKKSINNISLEKAIAYINSTCFTKSRVGEIDFIVVDKLTQTIYVIDAKHMKTRYHIQSFATDQSRFNKEKGYEDKLSYKVDWVAKHLFDIGKELNFDCLTFLIQGLFVTETFVYYSMHSKYPIIPIEYLEQYFKSNDRLCFL